MGRTKTNHLHQSSNRPYLHRLLSGQAGQPRRSVDVILDSWLLRLSSGYHGIHDPDSCVGSDSDGKHVRLETYQLLQTKACGSSTWTFDRLLSMEIIRHCFDPDNLLRLDLLEDVGSFLENQFCCGSEYVLGFVLDVEKSLRFSSTDVDDESAVWLGFYFCFQGREGEDSVIWTWFTHGFVERVEMFWVS